MVGVGGIGFVVGKKWENYVAHFYIVQVRDSKSLFLFINSAFVLRESAQLISFVLMLIDLVYLVCGIFSYYY